VLSQRFDIAAGGSASEARSAPALLVAAAAVRARANEARMAAWFGFLPGDPWEARGPTGRRRQRRASRQARRHGVPPRRSMGSMLLSLRPAVSVIIPALDEESGIAEAVRSVAGGAEVIVVDGGSRDRTIAVARAAGARVLQSPAGRALQMNAGAAAARGERLLFLHADCRLPVGWAAEVARILDREGALAGAFRLSIERAGVLLRGVEFLANLRSRWLRMPYGDQALFLRREAFAALGGFPPTPVMEDYALVRLLRRAGRIRLSGLAVSASARRWQRRGVFRTTAAHQAIVVGWHLGIAPHRLARWR
jgi:rSAM/selenodomain-associated transferase 2